MTKEGHIFDTFEVRLWLTKQHNGIIIIIMAPMGT